MQFDIEDFDALRDYLIARELVKSGETVSFRNLPGGVSNRTVKVAWEDGRGWVLKQALAKLRVNVDWFSSPQRIEVEARALRWLRHAALLRPRMGPDAEGHEVVRAAHALRRARLPGTGRPHNLGPRLRRR